LAAAARCKSRKAASAARSTGVHWPCAASWGRVAPINVFIAASACQSLAAVAALSCCPSCSSVWCLSMFVMHALPAGADRGQQTYDLVDDGRVHVDAGAVQAGCAIVVQPAQVGHDFAALLKVERAGQSIDD